MKRLNEITKNPIVRLTILILFFIALIILLIPAIPYAIVRGACNLDYYVDWIDFVRMITQRKKT